MAKIKPINFRGVAKAQIITVLEGEGVESDPVRLVYYVIDEYGKLLGVIDRSGNITEKMARDWARVPPV